MGQVPSVGDRLSAGRYGLVERVAQGGHGQVWRADDANTGQPVAIKLLAPERADDAEAQRMLRSEARNGSLVHHPNVVETIDYHEPDGDDAASQPSPDRTISPTELLTRPTPDDADLWYLVTEFVHGQPLTDIIRAGPVPPDRLFTVLAHVARGLRAIHAVGLVHRDLAPKNLLVTSGDQVKILDFGISGRIGAPALTEQGLVPATAEYLAPELSLGSTLTPAADIYSLGIIALEGLTGTKPFQGPTPEDTAAAHVIRPAPKPPTNLPSDLRLLLYRMVDKDPTRRPANALAVALLFEGFACELADDDVASDVAVSDAAGSNVAVSDVAGSDVAVSDVAGSDVAVSDVAGSPETKVAGSPGESG